MWEDSTGLGIILKTQHTQKKHLMRIQVNASSKQILFGQIAMLFLNPNNLSCPLTL